MIESIAKVFILCCVGFVVVDMILYVLVKIKDRKKIKPIDGVCKDITNSTSENSNKVR